MPLNSCVSFPPIARVASPLNSLFQETELEDDDDCSNTVTSTIVSLTHPTSSPAPVAAEDLAAKLESITTVLIEEGEYIQEASDEEAKSIQESPDEGPSIAGTVFDDSTEEPSQDEPIPDLPSNDEPVADLGITTQDLFMNQAAVNVLPPSDSCSDGTDTIPGHVCADDKVTADPDFECVVEEEDDLPSEDDFEGFEPWVPEGEIPVFIITPPSDVDPEDVAQDFDSEGEQEESEDDFECEYEERDNDDYDDGDELEYAGDYPDLSVTEVLPASPPSPVRDDPCRSPITTSGLLWSDDDESTNDPGPLPFVQTEAQDPFVSEEVSDTVTEVCEDSNGTCVDFRFLEKKTDANGSSRGT